jgi:tetratricopeptide (TPR) repeat protein
MNIKQPIVIVAAMSLVFSAQAQSVDDGIKNYQYEKYQTAKGILTPLSAADPKANYYLGLSELGLENTDAARTIFAKYPEDAANMAGMARIAYITKNAAEGTRLAGVVAEKAKKKEWEQLKLAADAINYTEGGNYQQAVDWYKKALERNDNPTLRIALGDAYLKIQGGGGEAMNNYENVTGKDANNSLAFSRIGALWYAAKNYKLALENYEKAKNADPSNPLPYRDLANAYYWTGKYELAKQNIEKYLELSDKSTDDQIQYMNILYLGKNYQEAAAKAQELIGKGIVKPGFYGILAYSQLELKDSANALNNVRTYFSVQDPKKIYPSDYLNYGKIMLANGIEDSADHYFGMAISTDTSKNKSETYRQIAEGFKSVKTQTGYEKAGQWYGRVAAEDPAAKALDYYYWGFWSFYGRKYDVAAEAFKQMEEKFKDQPSAVYWRGRVASAQDEEAKLGTAREYYDRWLAIEQTGYERKNADLMYAYQYLALYYFNSGDKAKAKEFLDKIEVIDANNAFLKQMKDAMAGAKPPKGK